MAVPTPEYNSNYVARSPIYELLLLNKYGISSVANTKQVYEYFKSKNGFSLLEMFYEAILDDEVAVVKALLRTAALPTEDLTKLTEFARNNNRRVIARLLEA